MDSVTSPEAIVHNCIHKIVQIIIQGRVRTKNKETKTNNWFAMQTLDLVSLRTSLDREMQIHENAIPAKMELFIYVNGPALSEPILLEQWVIIFQPSYALSRPPNQQLQLKRQMWKDMTVLMRSLYCKVRLLPATRLFHLAQEEVYKDVFNLTHELFVGQRTSAHPLWPATPQSFSFSTIETGIGALKFSVFSRADCNFDFTVRQGPAINIIPNYVQRTPPPAVSLRPPHNHNNNNNNNNVPANTNPSSSHSSSHHSNSHSHYSHNSNSNNSNHSSNSNSSNNNHMHQSSSSHSSTNLPPNQNQNQSNFRSALQQHGIGAQGGSGGNNSTPHHSQQHNVQPSHHNYNHNNNNNNSSGTNGSYGGNNPSNPNNQKSWGSYSQASHHSHDNSHQPPHPQGNERERERERPDLKHNEVQSVPFPNQSHQLGLNPNNPNNPNHPPRHSHHQRHHSIPSYDHRQSTFASALARSNHSSHTTDATGKNNLYHHPPPAEREGDEEASWTAVSHPNRSMGSAGLKNALPVVLGSEFQEGYYGSQVTGQSQSQSQSLGGSDPIIINPDVSSLSSQLNQASVSRFSPNNPHNHLTSNARYGIQAGSKSNWGSSSRKRSHTLGQVSNSVASQSLPTQYLSNYHRQNSNNPNNATATGLATHPMTQSQRSERPPVHHSNHSILSNINAPPHHQNNQNNQNRFVSIDQPSFANPQGLNINNPNNRVPTRTPPPFATSLHSSRPNSNPGSQVGSFTDSPGMLGLRQPGSWTGSETHFGRLSPQVTNYSFNPFKSMLSSPSQLNNLTAPGSFGSVGSASSPPFPHNPTASSNLAHMPALSLGQPHSQVDSSTGTGTGWGHSRSRSGSISGKNMSPAFGASNPLTHSPNNPRTSPLGQPGFPTLASGAGSLAEGDDKEAALGALINSFKPHNLSQLGLFCSTSKASADEHTREHSSQGNTVLKPTKVSLPRVVKDFERLAETCQHFLEVFPDLNRTDVSYSHQNTPVFKVI